MSEALKVKLRQWHDKLTIHKVDYILETPADCKFIFKQETTAAPKEIGSYKWILSAISPVFESMFNEDARETTQTPMEVEIDDIEYDDFKRFLDYVYFGNLDAVNWPAATWHIIPHISKKYEIPEMMETIFKRRKAVFRSHNILNYFDYACDNDADKLLLCFNEIDTEHLDFLLLNPQLLTYDTRKFLILHSRVYVNDWASRFKLSEKWFEGCKNLGNLTFGSPEKLYGMSDEVASQFFKKVLIKVDDLSGYEITLKDFLDGPAKSTNLSIDDKYTLLMKIVAYHFEIESIK